MQAMKIHRIAELIPMMSDDEYSALKADIKEYGQVEPIWLWEGQIIDGRNRERACRELGFKCMTKVYEGNEDDVASFVMSMNVHRRHLSTTQRSVIAATLANMPAHRPSAQICALNSESGSVPKEALISQPKAAKLLKVSRRNVQMASKVIADGAPELINAMQKDDISVAAASEIVKLPKKQQTKVVQEGAAQEEAAVIRKKRKAKQEPKQDEEDVEALKQELEKAKDIIYEITHEKEMMEEEIEMLRRIADSDDRIKAALGEVKQYKELNRVLKERINGLMNEKNEAIRLAKSWRKKAGAR